MDNVNTNHGVYGILGFMTIANTLKMMNIKNTSVLEKEIPMDKLLTIGALKPTLIYTPHEKVIQKEPRHIQGLWNAVKSLEESLNEAKRVINCLHDLQGGS